MRISSCLVVFALFVTACGGDDGGSGVTSGSAVNSAVAPTGMIVGGRITDEALAEIVADDGTVDQPKMDALVTEVLVLPVDEQMALASDLSLRVELAAADASGLAAAAGGREALTTALSDGWRPIQGVLDAGVPAPSTGLRRVSSTGTPQGAAATGIFMGYMALAMTANALVSSSGRMEPGATDGRPMTDGMAFSSSLEKTGLQIEYKGTEQSGVEIQFSAKSEIEVCPDADGVVDITALVDVRASKNGVGQNASMDMSLSVRVGDDAEPMSKTGTNRIQWANYANGKGQFIDMTSTGQLGLGTIEVHREAGAVTAEFVRGAAVLGQMMGAMIMMQIVDAAVAGWKSGRCVTLTASPSAGPKGMTPGAQATISAQPRSKIDGAPTGGTVTAVLSGGASSVEPSSTPLPADAEFTYTAPGEKDSTGTVTLEARSKRGIGTASVEFDTTSTAYSASFNGGGVSISGTVASLTDPFDLAVTFTGGSGTFSQSPSDETSGSVGLSGGGSGATLSGGGSYTVADNGDGTKTVTLMGEACVDVSGVCNEFVHPVLLTPISG